MLTRLPGALEVPVHAADRHERVEFGVVGSDQGHGSAAAGSILDGAVLRQENVGRVRRRCNAVMKAAEWLVAVSTTCLENPAESMRIHRW